MVPYLASLLLCAPYLCHFIKGLPPKVPMGHVFLSLIIVSYFLWLGRLIWILKSKQPELEKILVRYLLSGQLLIFIPPVSILGILILFGITIPVNFLSPIVLLIPIALIAGIIPGQRRQLQTYIVQSEKRVALGDLLSGLAHELNNPLTFVYSNVEPLKEFIA